MREYFARLIAAAVRPEDAVFPAFVDASSYATDGEAYAAVFEDEVRVSVFGGEAPRVPAVLVWVRHDLRETIAVLGAAQNVNEEGWCMHGVLLVAMGVEVQSQLTVNT